MSIYYLGALLRPPPATASGVSPQSVAGEAAPGIASHLA